MARKNTIKFTGLLVKLSSSSTGKYAIFEVKRPKSGNVDTIYVACNSLDDFKGSKWFTVEGELNKSTNHPELSDFIFIKPTQIAKTTKEVYEDTYMTHDPNNFKKSFLKNNHFTITGSLVFSEDTVRTIEADIKHDVVSDTSKVENNSGKKQVDLVEFTIVTPDGVSFKAIAWGKVASSVIGRDASLQHTFIGRLTTRKPEGTLEFRLTVQTLLNC